MEIPHCELEKYHYNTLKDWRYASDGMMDCLQEEISGYLPYLQSVQLSTKDVQAEPIVKPQLILLKMDKAALNLNRRVAKLENASRYLLKKIKEIEGHGLKQYEPF